MLNQSSLSVNLSKRDKGMISTPLDDSLLVEFNPHKSKDIKHKNSDSKFNNQEIKINRAHRTMKQTVQEPAVINKVSSEAVQTY